MTSSPQVHRAGFTELDPVTAYRIWQLRSAVFVVEQNCVYPDLDDRDLEPTTLHLWVEADGAPVAYARVLDEGDHARIGRVATARSHRGRGLAAALMKVALDELDELDGLGGRDVAIHAQAHLSRWYEGFGFVVDGEEFLDDGIPHVPMVRRT